MKKLLNLLLSLVVLCGSVASADTWVGAGQQPIVYTSAHTIGDGSDAQGGIAPGYAYEPADIASNFTTTPWLTSSSISYVPIATGLEAKFRGQCYVSHIKQEDPMLGPGLSNFSHLHEFFGNTLAGKDSTYTSLRTTGASTCSGGPLNRTAYWFPAVERVKASGVTVVYKPDIISIYYVTEANDPNYPALTRIPRNFGYIGGVNPSDPNNTRMQSALAEANGAGGNYNISGTTTPTNTNWGTGFAGWSCVSTDLATQYNGSNANSPVPGNANQPYLKNPDGTATLTCPAGPGVLEADINAPDCWDGHNLHSPDARSHVSYKIHDNNTGKDVCPDHWYQIPRFEAKFFFSYKDPSEIKDMFLSSDVMDYGAPSSSYVSPCRKVSNHYCNGESFHFDWFGAWDYGTGTNPGVMLKWMNHCAGVRIRLDGVDMAADGNTCNYSTIDQTERMLSDSPTPDTSLDPGDPTGDVANVYNYAGGLEKSRYFPITPGTVLDLHGMTHVNN